MEGSQISLLSKALKSDECASNVIENVKTKKHPFLERKKEIVRKGNTEESNQNLKDTDLFLIITSQKNDIPLCDFCLRETINKTNKNES